MSCEIKGILRNWSFDNIYYRFVDSPLWWLEEFLKPDDNDNLQEIQVLSSKFKVGDIVRLAPWDDFDDHTYIHKLYWQKLYGNDLIIERVVTTNMGVDYQFQNCYYRWREDFIKILPMFPEELFEI